jgi:hypothetical protein
VRGVAGESVSDVLVDHAIRLSAVPEGADSEEVVAELLALSGRSREALEEALARVQYLHPGEDATRTEAVLRDALRRGDAVGFWRIDLR